MRWLPLVVVLVACSSPVAAPPAGDAGADAAPPDARTDAVPVDADPGPTPEQWAACPDNLADLGYSVRSCSYVSGAFGLEHPARRASVVPTWVFDDSAGNRALTMEEAIAFYARQEPGADVLRTCDLRQFPPACRCDCTGQQFDIRSCAGFENGRMYLAAQLTQITTMVARTGKCPRLH
jgi:hypothetical protein